MRTRRLTLTLGLSILLLAAGVPAAGQGEGAAKPAVARPWPPARLADGQPDVQGVWAAQAGGVAALDRLTDQLRVSNLLAFEDITGEKNRAEVRKGLGL